MSDDVLRHEHESLQRAVIISRKNFEASPAGAFVVAMMAAMDEYHAMRKTGVSQEDACKGIEAVIWDVWPKPTTKFHNCPDCDATGWREMTCWHEQRCGRESCARRAHPSLEHLYVVPCDCPGGDRHRPRVFTPEDALTKVGKTSKPKRGFSRMGQ